MDDFWGALGSSGLDDAIDELAKVLDNAPQKPIHLWDNPPSRVTVNWQQILSEHSKVYRGFGIKVSPVVYAKIFDAKVPLSDRADEVFRQIHNVHMHWSFDRGEAAGYAGQNAQRGDVRIILTAYTPRADEVITDERTLKNNYVYGLGYENEIPVKPGTTMRLKQIEWAPGGPTPVLKSDDGGGWLSYQAGATVIAARTKFGDFERGQRVTVTNHPDEPGTIVAIRGQGNAYTSGYIQISFDNDPDRPAWYPWRDVLVTGSKTGAVVNPWNGEFEDGEIASLGRQPLDYVIQRDGAGFAWMTMSHLKMTPMANGIADTLDAARAAVEASVRKTGASRQDVGVNMLRYFYYGTTDIGMARIKRDGEIDEGRGDLIISTRFEDMHDSPVVITLAIPYTWLWDHLDSNVREVFQDRQAFFNVMGQFSGELTVLAPIPSKMIKPIGKSAALFNPSQMLSWEQTRPWNLSREEAESQTVDGWWGKQARGTESASWDGRYIRPAPEFYSYPEATRRAIAYHEAGHAMLQAAGGLSSVPNAMELIDMLPGAKILGYNAEEIIAEAYSVLWTEPEWFSAHDAGQIEVIVVGLAHKAGFPVP